MKKTILLLLLSLILVTAANAATITGTVYDFSLEKINNVIVEVNTIPTQREIAKIGSYSFNLAKGSYTITAKTIENKLIATENITIKEEGTYNLDLISFIDISEEEELSNHTNLDIVNDDIEISETNNYLWLVLTFILIIVIAGIIYYKKRKPIQDIEEITDDLKEKILEIIKRENGRTTQKELRKLLPYSEAKISLVLTELESKGKIEKIKKGRSNVIILKK